MEHGTQSKIDLFAENVIKAHKGLEWGMIDRFAALLYAIDGKQIDCNAILSVFYTTEGYKSLSLSTQVKSSFADVFSTKKSDTYVSTTIGETYQCLAVMLAPGGDSKKSFDRIKTVRDMMDTPLKTSDFSHVVAYLIATNSDPEDYQKTVARMTSFYNSVETHKWGDLGTDNRLVAAKFALSGLDLEESIKNVEKVYKHLEPKFHLKINAFTFTLMAVANGLSDKADSVLALREVLLNHKISANSYYTDTLLCILAMLALSPAETEKVIKDIKEVWDVLRTKKGLGHLASSVDEVMLYSAAIVLSERDTDLKGSLITDLIMCHVSLILVPTYTRSTIIESYRSKG